MKKWRFIFTCALAFTLAACSSSTTNTNSTTSNTIATQPIEVEFTDATNQKHQFTQVPSTIATLNPGVMDILLALGANVTGRPTISGDISEDVKAIQDLGNVHQPSIEQIVALHPEVLVVPPSFQTYASTIEAAGIRVVYEDIDAIVDIEQAIKKYGELFAAEETAAMLVAEIQAAKEISVSTTKNALVVYGAPGTYLAALDNSLYGDILNKAGGKNIASNLPALDQYPTYASLSAEKIVEGNPQVILLITHADEGVVKKGFEKQMSQNPAWKNVDAVKNGHIIILPSKLFDNPGTQIVEALAYMRSELEKAEATK